MRSLLILTTFSLVLALGLFSSTTKAEIFTSNLTVGSRGVEVSALQQILVSEGYLVMPTGVSYGYFGPLTKSAVAMWQSANGVLPTLGYFGPISRATLSAKTSVKNPEPPTQPTMPVEPPSTPVSDLSSGISANSDTPFALGMRANRILFFRASPLEVKPGDIVTLDGSGFSKTSNKVYFSGGNAVVATSTNGTVMNVVVPPGLSNGEHELTVENVLGSSANPDLKIIIRVTDNPQPPPQITSASISGDTVTLIGTGFTSSNNLSTTFGDNPSSILSNGTTLTFRITDLSMYEKIKQFTQGKYQTSLWIYIYNEHGASREPYQLNVNI
ncbi:MAG: IPT/TIG domain-containing protein [Patescibacteria group bacterium]